MLKPGELLSVVAPATPGPTTADIGFMLAGSLVLSWLLDYAIDKEPENGRLIALPAAEVEALLERLAETGARRDLHDVGLDGQNAAEGIRDLRSLLVGFRVAKQTAVETAVRRITTGILLELMAGIAIRLKLFGPSS